MGAFGNIHAGYMGLATIGGSSNVRFDSANIAVMQEVEAPDLIMGDYDHDAYVYGKITVGGSISGPITENSGNSLWEWASQRGSCGELTEKDVAITYYCGVGKTLSGVVVGSYGLSCQAGEVAQFNMEVAGKAASSGGGPGTFTDAEKLVTWDKVNLTASGGGADFSNIDWSSFDFNLNNNVENAYALNSGDLFPAKVIGGLRTFSGTITGYDIPGANGFDSWDDYSAGDTGTLGITMPGGISISVAVRWHRVVPQSSVGVMTSTVGFSGVTHQNF